MRRILPQHFKRNGLPKRAYTKAQAKVEAERSSKHAYRCDFCSRWHVGGRG